MKITLILLLTSWIAGFCNAQASYDLHLAVNTNTYFPFNSEKGVFPAIGYDKDGNPKLLIGGFGVGLMGSRQIDDKSEFRLHANLLRYAYWNVPLRFVDEQNQPLGDYTSPGNDYNLGLLSTYNYSFTKRFSAGSGLGLNVLLFSVTPKPMGNYQGADNSKPVRARHYKMLMPILPLQVSYRFLRTLYSIRYEFALLNKFGADLAKAKKESYGIATFEVAFKLDYKTEK